MVNCISVSRTRFHRGQSVGLWGAGGAGGGALRLKGPESVFTTRTFGQFAAHMSQATNTLKWQERKLEGN